MAGTLTLGFLLADPIEIKGFLISACSMVTWNCSRKPSYLNLFPDLLSRFTLLGSDVDFLFLSYFGLQN